MNVKKAKLIDKTDNNKVIAIYEQSEYYELAVTGSIRHVYSWNLDGTERESDFFASIHVKWDGCSHFWFTGENEDKESYYHICGIYNYVEHMAIMMFVYHIMVAHVGEDRIDEKEEFIKLKQLNILDDYEIVLE